ncbi:MAG: hypothetical protein ABW133_06790, partial [Polyangiaceae bacterium]
MNTTRAHLFLFTSIALAPRFAMAQTAPVAPQRPYYQAQPGAVAQQGYPQQSHPQQGYPQQGYAQQQPYPQGAQPAAYPQNGYQQQNAYPGQQPAAGQPLAPQSAQPGSPQVPQGNKARSFPQGFDPQQGGAMQQPIYGGAVPLGGGPAGNAGLNDAPTSAQEDFGHHKQVNFRAEFLSGYRMLYRYKESPRCAPYDTKKAPNDQQKFCGYGSAPAIGMAIGFSIIDSFEPFVFLRLGVANEATETNQGKLVQAGFGARFYAMPTDHFKMFFQPWLGVDATSGPGEAIGSGTPGSPGYDDAVATVKPGSYKTDLLAHFSLGPQYDFSRSFGVYLSGGLTVQMVRYFGTSADIAIGLQ